MRDLLITQYSVLKLKVVAAAVGYEGRGKKDERDESSMAQQNRHRDRY